MNDDFLHRIRKTPPPEFLARLKVRLDRQPVAPPPRRRWSFTRGVLTGLLLGGAAFALTAVSLTGGRPDSLRSFVSAPVRFLARLMPGGHGSDEHPEQDYKTHAVPLGPVWLPAHPAANEDSRSPHVPTQSAGFAVKKSPGAENSTAPPTPASNNAVGGLLGRPAFDSLRIAAPITLYPLVSRLADYTNNGSLGHIQVQLDTGNPFDGLCVSNPAAVDAVEIPRRITRAEFNRCNSRPRYIGIVEVKLGYQALVLARAQLYGPLKLSARELFLAMARRVPAADPNNPQALIDNPNTTWNQVNGTLPYDKILIVGPDAGSAPGQLVGDLLLEPGCNSYPWIAALRESDPARYEEICGSVREDGTYLTAAASGWAYRNQLTTNPTSIGIFSLNEFRTLHDGLVLNPIDGIEPTEANIAAGTYSAGRTLYLYSSEFLSAGNQLYMTFVRCNLYPYSCAPTNGWGSVALDKSETEANLLIALQHRELKF